jgi:hypothetical protein
MNHGVDQTTVWKQIWDATWTTHRHKFSGIITHLYRHRDLLQSHASLEQIKAFQEARRLEDARWAAELQNQSMTRLRAVTVWLKPASMSDALYRNLKKRTNCPSTGRWLFENSSFKDWFDPQYWTPPLLLWLHGQPGAGEYISFQ